MQIMLTFDVAEATAQDAAALHALADALMSEGASVADPPSAPVIQMADRKAEQEAAPEKAVRRPRKAAAPKAPEPEPEPSEEDLLGSDEEVTLDTAVARAQALVKQGKGKAIKAALEDVGAEKVRDLTDEQVPEFLAALEDA